MTTPAAATRSYGCTFGCGNPYDIITISISDGTTEFLCFPCFVRMASDILTAITNPEDGQVAAAVAAFKDAGYDLAPGPQGAGRGHNAPATTEDPDIFAAYADVTTVDELPEEFR